MEPLNIRLRQQAPPGPPPTGRESLRQDWPGTWWADVDKNGWTFSVHLVEKNHTIICDEVRVKPAEAVGSSDPTLLYELNSIPGHGLGGTMIRNFSFSQLIKAGIHELMTPPDSDEGIDHLDWEDDLRSGGFDPEKAKTYDNQQRRGRPPLAADELAEVARLYVEALGKQAKAPIAYVAKALGEPNPDRIRNHVNKCRERGFLTEAPAKGVAGGHLTPKAIEVIKRLGPDNRAEQGDSE